MVLCTWRFHMPGTLCRGHHHDCKKWVVVQLGEEWRSRNHTILSLLSLGWHFLLGIQLPWWIAAGSFAMSFQDQFAKVLARTGRSTGCPGKAKPVTLLWNMRGVWIGQMSQEGEEWSCLSQHGCEPRTCFQIWVFPECDWWYLSSPGYSYGQPMLGMLC